MAELFGAAHPIVIFGEMFPHQIGLEFWARLPADGDAARPQVPAVDAAVGQIVEGIALPLGPLAREPDVDAIIHDGQVDHAFEAALMIIAEFAARHRFELVGWLGGGQIDHAGGRVTTIECALRPAQDFDLRHVIKFLLEEMVADKGDIVERDRDSRIGCHRNGLRADAA